MADLKETIVDGLKIRRPASAADEAVRKHIDGKNVLKAIVVKNKLVNLVVQ